MFTLGMVYKLVLLFYVGDTEFKLPKAGNGKVFFLLCKSRQRCSSTVPLDAQTNVRRLGFALIIVGR